MEKFLIEFHQMSRWTTPEQVLEIVFTNQPRNFLKSTALKGNRINARKALWMVHGEDFWKFVRSSQAKANLNLLETSALNLQNSHSNILLSESNTKRLLVDGETWPFYRWHWKFDSFKEILGKWYEHLTIIATLNLLCCQHSFYYGWSIMKCDSNRSIFLNLSLVKCTSLIININFIYT